jgi:short-subunit dehydrogenase
VELNGSVGIVTGASRGIGVRLAEALANKGVHLALAARSHEDLESTAKRITGAGVRAVSVPTDVTKPDELKALVNTTTEELGPVDLLVNNAGIEHYARFEREDLDRIEAIFRTNVLAAELLTRFVLPGMVERRRGHIVNISSAAGKTALPYNTVYSSSKHALVGFSWSLREEMRPYGIGVSVVCPGFVTETGMFADWSKGKKPPAIAGAVSPQRVAEQTVRAIERNRAEVIVAPRLGRIVDVFHAISPEVTTWAARRGGLYRFLAQEIDRES